MLTIHNQIGQSVTLKTLADFDNPLYFKGSVISDDTYVQNIDFSMGSIFPMLDYDFQITGYHLSKGKTYYKAGQGVYLGRDGKNIILTDDQAILKTVYDLDCAVIYDDDLDTLIENAMEKNRAFKIITNSTLRLGFQKHLVNLPQNPTKHAINALFSDKGALSVVSAKDVQAKPITWLWKDWLPLGKLTILAGVGGCGKTNIVLNLIATITKEGVFPDGSKCHEKGEVLIYSTEDDTADTLKPRLMANGADLSKVFFINGRIEKGELQYFDASEDLPLLFDFAENRNIKLILIDPIISAVGKDINKANDVRASLQVLVDFASSFNCAVVGITHFAKGTKGADPTERIIGSQAFSALARMNWVAVKPSDPAEPCLLTKSKTNITKTDGGFNYEIEPIIIDGIETTKIKWGGFKQGTAKQLLKEIEDDIEDKPFGLAEQAEQFLLEILRENGEMKATIVQGIAKEADITLDTLRRAREKVCNRPTKKDDGWYWQLKPAYLDIESSLANVLKN